jgi:DNA-binding transcriptional ArsR family regulator
MSCRVLLTTFGFEERKVLQAMRDLPYDRLLLVLGPATLERRGFRRLCDLEPRLETLLVDPFRFEACYRALAETIDALRAGRHRVTVNVSGGTKVLADAALLVGFHKGVPTYHCEGETIRLPVLHGVRVASYLSAKQRRTFAAIDGTTPLSALVHRLTARDMSESSVRQAVQDLRRLGLLDAAVKGGRVILRPSDQGVLLRPHLLAAMP